MITYVQAKQTILKANPVLWVKSASEFPDFYLFVLAPVYVNPGDDYVTGTVFPTVSKKDGSIGQIDILTDDIDIDDGRAIANP